MQVMKMAREVTCCCVLLFLALTLVSAAKGRLNSISDLKRCGQSAPTNRLELLHWFAGRVDINHYNGIRLNFDPLSDYGSHHYGNYDGLLPWGNYWTVGNILQDTSLPLPSYVVNPHRGTAGWNRARIIFGSPGGRQTVDRIYITEHYETSNQGSQYDSAHTYEVTTNLLQELRRHSIADIQRLSDNSHYSYTLQSAQRETNQFSFTPQTNQSHFLRNLLLVLVLVIGLIVLLPILGNGKKY